MNKHTMLRLLLQTAFLFQSIHSQNFSNIYIAGNFTINVYAITTSFSVGESVQRGHQLAIDMINSNTSLLPHYKLNMTVYDSGDDSTKALLHALKISFHAQHYENSSLYIPIVLGCDWSSLSAVTAPTLSAFHWAQISASSTSTILSETNSFSHFYRTIPDDTLQAHSLIHLCELFDWREIGVIHVNDNWGVYLAVKIAELATEKKIEVNSIAFERENHGSYDSAVRAMKQIGIFIIILITHGMYPIFGNIRCCFDFLYFCILECFGMQR